MKKLLPELDHRAEALILLHQFYIRLAPRRVIAIIVISLSGGMLGYHIVEGFSWIDAFLNASVHLGGKGPVTALATCV